MNTIESTGGPIGREREVGTLIFGNSETEGERAQLVCMPLLIAYTSTCQACASIYAQTHRRIRVHTDARTDARTDSRTDTRTDGRTHRRTHGRTDGHTHTRTQARRRAQPSHLLIN